MLNKNLEIELNKQQILPILNTTELLDDIKRLEVFLSNHSNIKNIEITMRQKNSFEIAKELKKKFY
jgi:2-keto-3-deoxy-6-phosphogluconate aldolase